MPRLPRDITSTSELCDWLELTALCRADANASMGDLKSALTVASYGETEDDSDTWEESDDEDTTIDVAGPDDDERVERRSQDVATEVAERAAAAPDAYPFKLSETGVLQQRSRWQDFPAYTFCLVLGQEGERAGRETQVAARLFELLATVAARHYIGGEALRFGFPRVRPLPGGFSDALVRLVELTGEGGGPSNTPVGDAKDDGLDIVAWRPFSDLSQGKVMLFGQCSIAQRWNSIPKPKELDIDGFCCNWFRKVPFSSPVKSLFTPHAVTSVRREKEQAFLRYCGILFDRCRIAQLIKDKAEVPPSVVTWTQSHLRALDKARGARAWRHRQRRTTARQGLQRT